jgi:hydroxypyruvate reductase
MKQLAERIFRNTLNAIDVRATLPSRLPRSGCLIDVSACGAAVGHARPAASALSSALDLRKFRKVCAIAFGKAAAAMAQGLTDVLAPDFPPHGICVVPAPPRSPLPGWETIVAGHPMPNQESFRAGRLILDLLRGCDEHSLVFFLVSGGGSALIEQPLDPGISQEDFRALNNALVTCGAPIADMNAVRKHFSGVKGGRLATAAPTAMKITLGVSDVPDGQESALASGPTLPDPSRVEDVLRIAKEFRLATLLPPSLRERLESQRIEETPKADDPAFARSLYLRLLGSHDLTHCAHRTAEGAGFVCEVDNSTNDWPLELASRYLLGRLAGLKESNPNRPVALIANGELSSPAEGSGVGGRNAAFVLTCVPKIAGQRVVVLSAGTDGIDGNSPAAGAVADGETMRRAESAGWDPEDYRRRFDSFHFFENMGDAVITGPTGNNLRDLRLLLAP